MSNIYDYGFEMLVVYGFLLLTIPPIALGIFYLTEKHTNRLEERQWRNLMERAPQSAPRARTGVGFSDISNHYSETMRSLLYNI